MDSIILMGIKHCGKSTQGKLISKKMDLPFFDTDNVITDIFKKSPREIYMELGEKGFRNAETEACKFVQDYALKNKAALVVATGGGICNNKEALNILHTVGKFVFLMADEKTAGDRIVREIITEADGTMSNLPAYIAKKNPSTILDVRNIFHNFYEERCRLYSDICDIKVQLKNAGKDENRDLIIEMLGKIS